MIEYTIRAYGENNIKSADKFLADACYSRGVYNHGCELARLQIVEGYDIKSNTTVDFVLLAYIRPRNVEKVLDAMKRLGFSGAVYVEAMNDGQGIHGTGFSVIL